MINANQNPKGSNVYKTMDSVEYTTPTGSHLLVDRLFYKYCNPTDCFLENKHKEAVK